MAKRATHRSAAVLGLLAAPILLGATLGAGSASASSWQVGPFFRAEYSGEAGQYICGKASSLEPAWRMTILVPCTYDPEAKAWYNVVFDPAKLAPWTWSS